MPTIRIRNVPEDVLRTLRVRAAASGQSLQEYVLDELTRHARSRDPADVIVEARAEIAAGLGRFSGRSSVDIIRHDRDVR